MTSCKRDCLPQDSGSKDPFECSCGRQNPGTPGRCLTVSHVVPWSLLGAQPCISGPNRASGKYLYAKCIVHLKCPSQSRRGKTPPSPICRIGAMGPRFQCESTCARFRSRMFKQVQIFISGSAFASFVRHGSQCTATQLDVLSLCRQMCVGKNFLMECGIFVGREMVIRYAALLVTFGSDFF